MSIQEAKNWFDSIAGTPLKDRIFVLMLFVIFILIGTNTTIWIHLTNKEKEAIDLKIEAERQLDILRNSNLKDNKYYLEEIRKAEVICNEKWAVKFEAERELNKKYLEEKANKLEQELQYLRNESRKIRSETKTLKQKVNI